MASAFMALKAGNELLVFDGSLPYLDELLGSVGPEDRILVLDPQQDGVLQLAEAVKDSSGLAGIHIVSHGAPGALQLGTAYLDANTLGAYEHALTNIGLALAATGEVLLYGCSVGQGEVGKAFVRQLARITGADVAASTNLTGLAALGSDWWLESVIGSVERHPFAAQTFPATLFVIDDGGTLLPGDTPKNLVGTDGEDTLVGEGGDDTLIGLQGNDALYGNGGNDRLDGGAGDDDLFGGPDADTLDGGEGVDWAYYHHAIAAVQIDLTLGTATGGEGSDTLIDVENLYGSDYADTLMGSSADNSLFGNSGNDSIQGGDGVDILAGEWGDDTLDGGADFDWAYYGDSFGAVHVNLTTGQALAVEGSDSLISVENVWGSSYDDTLVGGSGENGFFGSSGNDSLYGDGGIDYVVFSGNFADYSFRYDGLNDQFTITDTVFGRDGTDIAVGVEILQFDDGERSAASIASEPQWIEGTPGNDLLVGGNGPDVLDGDDGGDTLFGGAGGDRLYGRQGDDSLMGGDGSDYLYGETEHDTLVGGGGDDELQGGMGTDTAVFSGNRAEYTIWYSSASQRFTVSDGVADRDGNDSAMEVEFLQFADGTRAAADLIEEVGGPPVLLVGTSGDDYLRGGDGDDTLQGLGGSDTLMGNAGHDLLEGGDGIDQLYGGAGDDTLLGGADVDFLYGGDGHDFIDGGDGYDILDGSEGNDTLTGGAGGGSFDGGAGHDVLTGGSDNDGLNGGEGDDWLGAAGGDDYLTGGPGRDTLLGGDGVDTAGYQFSNAVAGVVFDATGVGTGSAVDIADGLGDTDRLEGIEKLQVFGSEHSDQFTGGSGDDSFFAVGGDDTVQGGAGNDGVSGGEGNDRLEGGAGDDALEGGGGSDTVVFIGNYADYTIGYGGITGFTIADRTPGRDGTDTATAVEFLRFADGTRTAENVIADVLYSPVLRIGTDGDDILEGAEGNDTLRGLGGNDALFGGGGADLLEGGQGNDDLWAGEGDDTLRGDAGNDTLQGQTGNDLLDGGEGRDQLVGHEGDDTLLGGEGDDVLLGREGNDSLWGDAGDDVLDGFVGDDTMAGGDGVDTAWYNFWDAASGVAFDASAVGSAGVVTLPDGRGAVDRLEDVERVQVYGSPHDDALAGSQGSDVVNGGSGQDTLDGHAGDDQLDGGEGHDLMRGGAGRDTLDGSLGDDTLEGGAGDDSIVGNGGSDTVVFAGFYGDYDITYLRATQHFTVADTLPGRDGTDRVVGVEFLRFADGTRSADAVIADVVGNPILLVGTEFRDDLETNEGNDTLLGLGSDDTLTGNAGDDRLEGGDGDDRLLGGPGNDTLLGGDGNDTLLGGGGNDVVAGGAGADLVLGDAGSDTLDGGALLDRIRFTDANVLWYADSPSAVMVNLQAGLADDGYGGTDTISNFTVVRGSDHDDLLRGSSSPVLEVFHGGLGNDTIDGGAMPDPMGGDGDNCVAYDFSPSGMTVSLTTGLAVASGGGGTDMLLNINQVRGSSYDDWLIGSDRVDVEETFVGRGGNDTIDGAGGIDIVRYDEAPAGVVVDLALGTATGGEDSDTLIDVENLYGSGFADTLIGSSADNSLFGNGGNDSIQGGVGVDRLSGGSGDDTLDGGSDHDWAYYSGATGPVNVNLATGKAFSVEGTDSLINIENVWGSPLDDTLFGDGEDNAFFGSGGNDSFYGSLFGNPDADGGTDSLVFSGNFADYRLSFNGATGVFTIADSVVGRDGTDTAVGVEILQFADGEYTAESIASQAQLIEGTAGNDYLGGGSGDDTLLGLDGDDHLEGMGGADSVVGGAGNDLLSGGTGNDTLQGGVGNDTLYGFDGIDTAIFSGNFADYDIGYDSRSEVIKVADLVVDRDGTDSVYQAEFLQFAEGMHTAESIANTPRLIVGTSGDDRLYGGGGDDTLQGLDGNDDLNGFGGADSLDGGAGDDSLYGVVGDDLLIGGAGNDVLIGGDGDDGIDGGMGVDQAVYGGARANHTVTAITGGYTVTDNAGSEGTDTLVSVERLVFSDTTLSLAPTPALANDTGASASDGITRDGTVAVSGLAAGGAWQFSTDGGVSWVTGSGAGFTLAAGSYAADAVQVRLSNVGGSPGEADSIATAVTVDTAGPAAPGVLGSGGATPVAVGGSTLLTISFDSPVAGFEASDLVDSKGGSFSGLASADGGTTWTLRFTPSPGKLGPASVAVTGAYTDLAGNVGQASAALAIGYFADATATDGYLRGASIYLDVDDSGTITASDFVLGQTGADGSIAVALTAGQDAHNLLVTGGTDIATNQAFTGLLMAPAGSTLVSPLTTLLTELIGATPGGSLAAAQAELLAALSLPAGIDLTGFDPLAVAVTQGATGQALADALAVQSQTVAVANLLSAGAATLQGAAASSGGVSAGVAGTAVLSALVDQIVGGTGAVDLSDAPTLAGLLNSAAADPGVLVAGLDATKQTAAVAAASVTLAATNQAIAQANSEAASAPTSQEFLSSLSKAVAVQVVAQGQITDQLAAGNTAGLPSDDRLLSTLANQVDLNGLWLTSTQPATADQTAARIVDVTADLGATADTIVYRAQLSEGADLSAGAPTLTLAKSSGGSLTLHYDASLSTSTSLAFSAAAPTDVEGTVAYQSADFGGVTLRDFSGNLCSSITLPGDLTAKTQTVAIHDTTPPASPTLALLNDNGTSASDGITSDGRVSVAGLEAGASWQYSIDGGQHWASGSGSSFTLAVGSYPAHTVLVRQIDAAGNANPADGQLASEVIIEAASGTLELLAFSWKAHTLLDAVLVHAGSHQGSTDADGALVLGQIAETSLSVTASREIPAGEFSATAQAVNLQDAIAILKLVVGLDVNGAGKALSPYQAYAADFDGNGAVGLTDAIGVLKHVVGLSSPDPQWLFFDESDPSVPGTAQLSPGAPPSISVGLAGADPVHLGLAGVLRGDVDGSHAGAAGAPHLDVQYFVDLVVSKHLDASQFGIYLG